MRDINREEFMTSKNEWDPSQLDDIEGASDLRIQQFPPIPIDATDSFYDSNGNIRAHKSDLEHDSVVSNVSNASSESRRRWYRLKSRKEKKRKEGKWVNNKKVKWKDQMKVPSFPTHLLPSPKSNSQIKGVPTTVASELQAYVNQAQVRGMQQIGDLVYYDRNSDDGGSEEDNDTFHDTVQVEDVIEETNDDDNNIKEDCWYHGTFH